MHRTRQIVCAFCGQDTGLEVSDIINESGVLCHYWLHYLQHWRCLLLCWPRVPVVRVKQHCLAVGISSLFFAGSCVTCTINTTWQHVLLCNLRQHSNALGATHLACILHATVTAHCLPQHISSTAWMQPRIFGLVALYAPAGMPIYSVVWVTL